MKNNLRRLRKELDQIDQRVVESLAARQKIIGEAAALKSETDREVRDPEREEQILARLRAQAQAAGLDGHLVTTLYREILDHSVRAQTDRFVARAPEEAPGAPPVVAYQGTTSAYSYIAAHRHFGARGEGAPPRCQGYASFGETLDAVARGEADYALLPVENTTAGSISEAYDLLARRQLALVGEEVLRIEHCLLTTGPEVPLHALRRVLSHPQALAQCGRFLSSLPQCERTVYTDTAMAAEKVRDDGDSAQAAIASREAAERCGLHVLRRDVADQKSNYTRFVVVARAPVGCDARIPCKTSLLFATPHERGALMRCLSVFAAHGLNLTKLESRPRHNAPWEYLFFVDFEGNAADPHVEQALNALTQRTNLLRVLGSYPAHAAWQSAAPPAGDGLASEAATAPAVRPIARPARPEAPASAKPPEAYRLASRAHRMEDTRIRLGAGTPGEVVIGGAQPVLIGGPCSVESREQIMACAQAVRAAGGHALRGGCFKPRTSPYSFQGLGYDGLDLLVEAGRAYNLPVVTEVLDPADVEAVAARADVLQIGARNMQNFALLKAVGQVDVPVLLKRGMMASVDEWLAAAEYVLAEGNGRVVLCLRGIRTFETATRSTLDLTVLPVLRERTHLPILVDPSHACGNRRWVPALAGAALTAGAHGVMVEMHPDPDHALSDGAQSLTFEAFAELAARLTAAAA